MIDRRGPVWRWITIAAVAAGITISLASPGHQEPYDAIFQVMIFGTAGAAGVLNRTKRANLAAAQSRAERAEAELDRHATREAAAERARIARELHDVVAHHVSLMAVQAEAATSLLPDKPAQARRSVEIIGDTARLALTELRGSSACCAAPPSGWRPRRLRRSARSAASSNRCAAPGCRWTSRSSGRRARSPLAWT